MYATVEDMIIRFGETKLRQFTDRIKQPTGQIDRAVIEAALGDATQFIDGYAAARYRVPLSPVPAPVLRWCADIAYYYLCLTGTMKEETVEAYKSAVAGLKDMSKGVIVFQADGLPTTEQSSANDIRLEAPDRVFTADSLRGF